MQSKSIIWLGCIHILKTLLLHLKQSERAQRAKPKPRKMWGGGGGAEGST